MGFFSSITKPFKKAFNAVKDVVGGVVDTVAPVLGPAGNLIEGLLGSNSNESANEANIALAREQMAYQKQLAQNQMQWRVEDAKKAGLHPMAALGLSSMSYSPVSSNVMPTDYSYLGDMGQNINRAVMQGKTAKERQQALDRQDQFDRIALRKANADADYAETLAASERLKLQRELFPPTPAVDGDNALIGGQGNAVSSDDNTFGDRVHNLYSLASFGDMVLTALNPDIADSLTESQVAHLSATLARDIEYYRNPKIKIDAFKKLTKGQQRAVVDGRAVFEYVPAVGGFMLTYPINRGKHEVSGKLRLE